MKKQGVLLGVAMMMALAGGVHAGEGPGRTLAETPATGGGDAQAGPWQADYLIDSAQGRHQLRIVMDDERVEYRALGEPVRQWRRVADGVELREINVESGRVIVHAPGDLRLRGREPDWLKLRHWGMGGATAGWQGGGTGEVRLSGGQRHVTRRWQPSASMQAEAVEWVTAAGVPVQHRHGGHTWRLTALTAVDAGAFTSSDVLEHIDVADLADWLPGGDHDPRTGAGHAHAH